MWMLQRDVSHDYDGIRVGGPPSCSLPGAGPHGPAIIGGIGDSGTRGAAQLLADGLDLHMCPRLTTAGRRGRKRGGCNTARDNVAMFHLYGGKVLQASNGSANYNAQDLGDAVYRPVYYHLCLAINHTLASHYPAAAVRVPDFRWRLAHDTMPSL